jgi:hypothetical protein
MVVRVMLGVEAGIEGGMVLWGGFAQAGVTLRGTLQTWMTPVLPSRSVR